MHCVITFGFLALLFHFSSSFSNSSLKFRLNWNKCIVLTNLQKKCNQTVLCWKMQLKLYTHPSLHEKRMAHGVFRDDRYFGNRHHTTVWPLWRGPCLFSQAVWINARKYMINTDRKSVRTNADKYASADSTPTTSDHNQHLMVKIRL